MRQPEEIFYFANGQINLGWVVSRAYTSAVQIDVDGFGTCELIKAAHCYSRAELSAEEIIEAEAAFSLDKIAA